MTSSVNCTLTEIKNALNTHRSQPLAARHQCLLLHNIVELRHGDVPLAVQHWSSIPGLLAAAPINALSAANEAKRNSCEPARGLDADRLPKPLKIQKLVKLRRPFTLSIKKRLRSIRRMLCAYRLRSRQNNSTRYRAAFAGAPALAS